MSRLALCLLLGACTPLEPGDALCPPGQGPVVGSSDVQTLGEGENHPVALAVLGGTLFWLNEGPPLQEVDEGSVVSRDLCSGVQHVLARGLSRPQAMVLAPDEGHIYWVNSGRSNGNGSMCRVALDGDDQDVRCLVSGLRHPSAIAREGTTLYVAQKGDLAGDGTYVPGTGAITRFDGAAGSETVLVDGLDAPSGVAVLGGVVSWTAEGKGALVDIDRNGELHATVAEGTGSVEQLRGGARLALASGLDAPIAVAAGASHTYWVTRGVRRGTGGVFREDASIASGLDFPGALALDAGGEPVHVAITGAADEEAEGHISVFTLGAPERSLASAQQLPRAIAVDRHLVYWVNFGRR
jgi:hypothetical protein